MMVWPLIRYGASVWGLRSFLCINVVQNRAMRFFLGTEKYTPNAAVSGDMGWQQTEIKQWKSICIYWSRMVHMDESRINKRVSIWSDRKDGRGFKNHSFYISENFRKLGHERYSDIRGVFSRDTLI